MKRPMTNSTLHNRVWTAILLIVAFVLGPGCRPAPEIPRLQKQGTATQLIVDGRPFLILGGELGNSTASSREALRPHWNTFKAANLNTILAPVYWELIEPEEGQFDLSSVEWLISDARARKMRLVLLWFGTWKNSMSCYVPAWVKKDQVRFPRAQEANGRSQEMLTSFHRNNLEADQKAFRRLMEFVRIVDGRDHTVIMVQVENEIGMIPSARDHSSDATQAYRGQVPAELLSYLRGRRDTLQPELRAHWEKNGALTSGTWEEVFGTGLESEEIFTAWHGARYTEEVTRAGKDIYPLPMFVNAALIREGYKPGQYPSGGPLPHLMDIWKAAAPSVDFLAPDIYHGSFVDWSAKFRRADNPLFIPEAGLSHRSAADAFYAIGKHDAIGFSPFAIESIQPEGHRLTQAYDLLTQLTPLIMEKQGTGALAGISVDAGRPTTDVEFGEYRMTALFEALDRWSAKPSDDDARGGCLVIHLSADEFLIAGSGVIVTFASVDAERPIAGIESIDEGVFKKGVWTPGRRLNGDQSHQGRHVRLPYGTFGIQRVRLYQYR